MKATDPINSNQALREGITYPLTPFVSGSSSHPSLIRRVSFSPSERRQRLSDVISMALALVEDDLLSEELCSDEMLIRENSMGDHSHQHFPRKQWMAIAPTKTWPVVLTPYHAIAYRAVFVYILLSLCLQLDSPLMQRKLALLIHDRKIISIELD
jgi:hypothetical protein